jgi:hypothetical protein
MKRCPSCNSTYSDMTLDFCLTDGTPLINETPNLYDPAQTLVSPNTPTSPPSYPQQQWGYRPARAGTKPKALIGLLVGLLLAAGIGVGIYFLVKKSAPTTPTESWKAFYAAAQKKDLEAMKKLMSRDWLKFIQGYKDKTVDEFIGGELAPGVSTKGSTETRNEKINGDKATIEMKTSDGQWMPVDFVREDGLWKLDTNT